MHMKNPRDLDLRLISLIFKQVLKAVRYMLMQNFVKVRIKVRVGVLSGS